MENKYTDGCSADEPVCFCAGRCLCIYSLSRKALSEAIDIQSKSNRTANSTRGKQTTTKHGKEKNVIITKGHTQRAKTKDEFKTKHKDCIFLPC